MAKMGRPKKEIDKEQFEKLCGIQCTYEEICDWFDVTDKTLNGWCRNTYGMTFSEVFAKKRNIGKISLRRHGYELAKKNAAVHIFYAKNHLGMKDTIEQNTTLISDETRESVERLVHGADTDTGSKDTEENPK